MKFQPTEKKENETPYYDDVTATMGYGGHATKLDKGQLEAEVKTAMNRVGMQVTGFQQGKFGDRDGYMIHFVADLGGGNLKQGRIEIAALPVRLPDNMHQDRIKQGYEGRKVKSLNMALYMFRQHLQGMFFMQQMTLEYVPFVPWLLVNETDTVSGMFITEQRILLPEPSEDFVDGEYEEIK